MKQPPEHRVIGIFPPGDARRLQAFYQEELGMELAVTGLAESSAQLSAEEAARLLAGASGAFAGISREPEIGRCPARNGFGRCSKAQGHEPPCDHPRDPIEMARQLRRRPALQSDTSQDSGPDNVSTFMSDRPNSSSRARAGSL